MSEPRKVSEHMWEIEASDSLQELSLELHDLITAWLERAKERDVKFHEAAMLAVQTVGATCAPLYYMHPENQERIGDMCRQNFVRGVECALLLLKDSPAAEQARRDYHKEPQQ